MNRSTIIISKTLNDLLKYINQSSDAVLVLFDIDNTLIVPKGFKDLESLIRQKILQKIFHGKNIFRAQEEIVSSFLENEPITMLPVEKNLDSLIQTIQQKVLTLAITARFPSLASYTTQHLKEVNINFVHTQFGDLEIVFQQEFPCLFKDGILFCGTANDKGTMILKLLEKLNYQPLKIIFIDDDMQNILSIKKALADSFIEYIGIHYQGNQA